MEKRKVWNEFYLLHIVLLEVCFETEAVWSPWYPPHWLAGFIVPPTKLAPGIIRQSYPVLVAVPLDP